MEFPIENHHPVAFVQKSSCVPKLCDTMIPMDLCLGCCFTLSFTKRFITIQLPSREPRYPTREKKNHLQKAFKTLKCQLLRGYHSRTIFLNMTETTSSHRKVTQGEPNNPDGQPSASSSRATDNEGERWRGKVNNQQTTNNHQPTNNKQTSNK